MTHACFVARPAMVGFAFTLLVALAGCGATSGLTNPGDGGPTADASPPPRDASPPPFDAPATGTCGSNADCPVGSYCAGDGCGTVGTCTPRPEVCRDPIGGPTCGCDGVTYSNDCLAEVAGTRVAFEGACEGPDVIPPRDDRGDRICLQGDDCAGSEYCAQSACGAPGSCVRRPDDCGPASMPVCSCDGSTFTNECFAHMAGQTAAFVGTCGGPGTDGGPPPPFDGGPSGCRSNAECSPTELCEQTSCGGVGICLPRMVPCMPGAVCGCDGRTYPSACVPFGLGVSIAHLGACERPLPDGGPPPFDSGPSGCLSNSDCAATDTCQGMSCFGPGACFPRTIPCVGGPVCGCDDVTYSQACGALARGVRIASFAPCVTTGGDGSVPPADVIRPVDAIVLDASAGGCFSNAECGSGAFCYASGCGTIGRCIGEPPMCPPFVSPVCGCDGVTYDNFCVAFQHGERFAHAGVCASTGSDGGGFPGDGGVSIDF